MVRRVPGQADREGRVTLSTRKFQCQRCSEPFTAVRKVADWNHWTPRFCAPCKLRSSPWQGQQVLRWRKKKGKVKA